MTLNSEWRDRLNDWRRELSNHFYLPLGKIAWRGFVTLEQLTPEEASRRQFKRMPAGARWGAKWEYGWFKASIKLPREAEGRRVMAYLSENESIVFVNGKVSSGQSWPAQLTLSGRAGQTLDLLVESYAGHGSVKCSVGPVPPDKQTLPSPSAQATVPASTFGIWEEDVYQLHIDVETLFLLRESLEQTSLRVSEIDEGLKDFTLIVDYELPREQLLKTVIEARKRLRPLLSCVNGSTVPTFYAIGHGHLDTAWLWPLQQSERKIARTISNQIALAREYGKHRFIFSQPLQYIWLQKRYPELYARLKAAVKTGHIIAEGGMWVESDTNITGGESLIRQFLHGKRFFKDEFGVDSRLLWLPDVFGYTAALPQIMKGCGVDYFTTQKIFWAYHGGDQFEHNHFMWRGLDGSEVLTFLHNDYNAETTPAALISRWRNRVQKDGLATFLFPFGLGDGGGGPNRNHLEHARRLENLEGVPRLKLADPIAFFEDLKKRGNPKEYSGELYFQAHRGTFTSQAKTKLGNRKGELILREAECWNTIASRMTKHKYPAQEIDSSWKALLLNQFHDILPGSSIGRVHQEAEADYERLHEACSQSSAKARAALVKRDKTSLTVFNSLSWARRVLVELPSQITMPLDSLGEPLPTQRQGKKRLVEAAVPACGWTTIKQGSERSKAEEKTVRATSRSIENELIAVKLNAKGEIAAITDKETGASLLAGVGNRLLLYKDVPSQFDAWDIDSMYLLQPVDLDSNAEIRVESEGRLFASIRVERRVNQSNLVQTIFLRRGSRRLDFLTEIDWREAHKMLKVQFPVNAYTDEAIHEIQFGHIRRPNHKSREYDRQRFEVCNHKWTALAEPYRGGAVLNDCKYGVSVTGNSINLTLLRAPLAPDEDADKGMQKFVYSFYAWSGGLTESGVVQEGYDLNCPASVVAGDGGEASIFQVDEKNIIIDTVKPAEKEKDTVVLRLYESMGGATKCALASDLPISAATETNLLEEAARPLKGNGILLSFRPFEIKTVCLKLRAGA